MDRVTAGETLAAGLALTSMELPGFWLRYFAVGGGNSLQQLRNYLDGGTDWSSHEHDIAGQQGGHRRATNR